MDNGDLQSPSSDQGGEDCAKRRKYPTTCSTKRRPDDRKHCPEVHTGGYLVLDAFTGGSSTAAACVHLSSQRGFVGCDLDQELVGSTLPSLLLGVTSHELNPKFSICASEDVESACLGVRGF